MITQTEKKEIKPLQLRLTKVKVVNAGSSGFHRLISDGIHTLLYINGSEATLCIIFQELLLLESI